ncbi:hypothetical protein [uncultured Brachyspira sp.]|uniref:hypothetical protein n=1 Tax=uncultured Brachyspira sp. TaxID=221953 RepID=UPI0032095F4B
MKTLIKIIPIVIILVIFLIIKNNPLNKVKGKLYLNEASGTGAYFEGKKVSLIVEGEDGGEFKLDMKWKNILFYHKEESNFYQIFILKGDTLYFTSMHTSEIERIGGVSGLQVDEYNKEYFRLKRKYDTIASEIDRLSKQIKEKDLQGKLFDNFISTFKKQNETISEFDEFLWSGLVYEIVVYTKQDVRFFLKNGLEIDTGL